MICKKLLRYNQIYDQIQGRNSSLGHAHRYYIKTQVRYHYRSTQNKSQ